MEGKFAAPNVVWFYGVDSGSCFGVGGPAYASGLSSIEGVVRIAHTHALSWSVAFRGSVAEAAGEVLSLFVLVTMIGIEWQCLKGNQLKKTTPEASRLACLGLLDNGDRSRC